MENLYRIIFREFADAGVQYLVVGGVAVNLHGHPRFTGDLDVLLALDQENLEKVTDIMKELHFTERLPVALGDLAKEKQVKKWLNEKNMTAFTFISSDMPQFSLDVLVDASLNFSDLSSRKELKRSWGATIPVISIDDLIGMKRESDREKDLQDLEVLLELQGL